MTEWDHTSADPEDPPIGKPLAVALVIVTAFVLFGLVVGITELGYFLRGLFR